MHSVLIADSSKDEVFLRNAKSVDNCHLGDGVKQLDCRGMGIVDKYDYALSVVDTPFVTVCGDDDFIIPAAVYQCASFLSKNNDYSHAHGKIVTFWEKCSVINPLESLRNYPQVANESDVYQRLINHFSGYVNNFYSVHRTNLLLRNFRTVSGLDIGRGLKERLIAALDIADGKRKMFDNLFILRQKGMTGTDESGMRTFNDNPADVDYFDQISFGYEHYLSFLRVFFECELSLGQGQVQNIMNCVERDYCKWKMVRSEKKNPKASVFETPRRAYRKIRGEINTFHIKYVLGFDDRHNLNMAVDAMREFYGLNGCVK